MVRVVARGRERAPENLRASWRPIKRRGRGESRFGVNFIGFYRSSPLNNARINPSELPMLVHGYDAR